MTCKTATGLDHALPPNRYDSEQRLVSEIVTLMRSEEFAPYIRIWLEIVAVAARGDAAHRASGHAIIHVFLEWLSKRHPNGTKGAPHCLTLIEGMLIMDA
ncbi:MAG: hypothetical protein AAF231_15865, partial [Pseudomonadota bacterium]